MECDHVCVRSRGRAIIFITDDVTHARDMSWAEDLLCWLPFGRLVRER